MGKIEKVKIVGAYFKQEKKWMQVTLKGEYTKSGEAAVYKTDNIVTDRSGSTVEIS